MPLCGRTERPIRPPGPNAGSGKFGSPWVRMHWENFSIAARWLADSAGGRPPFGSFEWQACIALWNFGELTATPLTLREPPDPTFCWIWMPPVPLLPGSGKLGTPLARMHFANVTIWSRAAARLVDGDDEPQAASPAAARTAISGAVRRIPTGVTDRR